MAGQIAEQPAQAAKALFEDHSPKIVLLPNARGRPRTVVRQPVQGHMGFFLKNSELTAMTAQTFVGQCTQQGEVYIVGLFGEYRRRLVHGTGFHFLNVTLNMGMNLEFVYVIDKRHTSQSFWNEMRHFYGLPWSAITSDSHRDLILKSASSHVLEKNEYSITNAHVAVPPCIAQDVYQFLICVIPSIPETTISDETGHTVFEEAMTMMKQMCQGKLIHGTSGINNEPQAGHGKRPANDGVETNQNVDLCEDMTEQQQTELNEQGIKAAQMRAQQQQSNPKIPKLEQSAPTDQPPSAEAAREQATQAVREHAAQEHAARVADEAAQAAQADAISQLARLQREQHESTLHLADVERRAGKIVVVANEKAKADMQKLNDKSTAKLDVLRRQMEKEYEKSDEKASLIKMALGEIHTEQNTRVANAQMGLQDACHALALFTQKHGIEFVVAHPPSPEAASGAIRNVRRNEHRTPYDRSEGALSIAKQVIDKSKPYAAKGPGPW